MNIKILMRDSVATHEGVFQNRKVYEVTKETAAEFTKHGWATLAPQDTELKTATIPKARRKASGGAEWIQ